MIEKKDAESSSDWSDAELLRRFETCELPPACFGHREHVRVAWLYLSQHDPLTALERFVVGLKRFATSVEAPGKYHETITWACVFLIRQRMQSDAPAATWQDFVSKNGDLVMWPMAALESRYPGGLLKSDLAKSCFLMPPAP